jgi:hypothetical protein
MILLVTVEVVAQAIDARGQERDLDFGGTGIFRIAAVAGDDFLFLLGRENHLVNSRL